MKKVTVLGSTGFVGQKTLEIIRRHPHRFQVEVLVAGSNKELLLQQALEFHPRYVALYEEEGCEVLKEALKGVQVGGGESGVREAAQYPSDCVVVAVVGFAALAPTMEALKRGACVAIANKESLVCAGPLMMEEAHRYGGKVIPVDSEHNALFQLLKARSPARRVILTASGGPFLHRDRSTMGRVTVEEAVCHPIWSMGPKISVDSATMMNKGLELIEARYLFNLAPEQIHVLVHPESIVHSMVEYEDDVLIAHMSVPDMGIPISYALSYPEPMVSSASHLDLAAVASLHFQEVDSERFPAMALAKKVLHGPEGASIVLNAANEVSVEAFLNKRLSFLDMTSIIEATLDSVEARACGSLEAVVDLDSVSRRQARAAVEARAL